MRCWTLLAVLAALCLLPVRSAGQTPIQPVGCTAACGCSSRMCQCSQSGGHGDSCATDGTKCTVFSCIGSLGPGEILVQAADGSLVKVKRAMNGDAPAEVQAVRPFAWRTRDRGHSQGVDCRGTVVAEYFDPQRAAAARARSRELVI